MPTSRRRFLQDTVTVAAGLMVAPRSCTNNLFRKKEITISLAEWSLHKTLFSKKMDNLDFPGVARNTYGIGAVEYVNQFFKDKAEDTAYLNQLLQRCKDHNVVNHLIMIDGEGGLAELDDKKRQTAIENHYKWVHAAKYLGCKTIRVNAYGIGSREDVQQAAIDGLSRLGEYAQKENINVIVENHGGYSSDGEWLSTVMKKVDRKNVGTLPDFGNFCLERKEDRTCAKEYDRYKGTRELMPYAKGVSAKTHDFDKEGNATDIDYYRMMRIVKDAGFAGYVGIEYEGSKLSEDEGIKKTKALLEKVSKSIDYALA